MLLLPSACELTKKIFHAESERFYPISNFSSMTLKGSAKQLNTYIIITCCFWRVHFNLVSRAFPFLATPNLLREKSWERGHGIPKKTNQEKIKCSERTEKTFGFEKSGYRVAILEIFEVFPRSSKYSSRKMIIPQKLELTKISTRKKFTPQAKRYMQAPLAESCCSIPYL